MLPFFNQYLKPGAPVAATPSAWIYDTGADHWDKPVVFLESCELGCPVKSRPLCLNAHGELSFEAPRGDVSGYELPIATDIFRGRYRASFERPEPIRANEPLPYTFALPMVNHTLQPGHRIMVQVQSTLFPLYDRNPQRFVPNIFLAKPEDYQKANQRIWHEPERASFISLPVVPTNEGVSSH